MKNRKTYYISGANKYAHSSVPWQQIVLRDLLEKIQLKKEQPCLDVGTGIGNNLPTLMMFSDKISAFDVSNESVKIAKEKLKNPAMPEKVSLIFVCADAERRMPYPDEKFAAVICTEVLEHCLCPEKVLSECFRVLESGGYAIFSVPNYFNLAGLFKKTSGLFSPSKTWDAWENHDCGIENFTTAFWLRNLMKKCGFTIVEERGGDLLRSWFPFLKKYYTFIDRHPALNTAKKWPFYLCAMNYFCLAKKIN